MAHYGSIDEDFGLALELERHSSFASQLSDKQPRSLSSRRTLAVVAVLVAAVYFATVYPQQQHHQPTPVHVKDHVTPSKSDPTRPFFYTEQLVDHYDPQSSGTYSQRYYESLDHFAGPGSPILVVLGGEDEVKRILYPFVSEHLAELFGAYTICIEHRFYGESRPLLHPTNADLRRLLSPAQGMLDFVQLIQHQQQVLGCGPRGSPTYCPVLTVGGSYPGFLSALMRLVHSDTVDIGYASSAPLYLYSHKVDQGAYFEKVTQVAEEASPGCKRAVHEALMDGQQYILSHTNATIAELAAYFGVCVPALPGYINSTTVFSEELMMIIANHFADNNMDYYPPTADQELVRGCKIFQKNDLTFAEKIAAFLAMRIGSEQECFDFNDELPPGPRGTITASDWSGVGGGPSGLSWDFQSCYLIPECGMSEASMFPPRKWTLEWLTNHCQQRFGVTPQPRALAEKFGFDDLSGASRLLITNGMHDGWSVASILDSVSDSVPVINILDGAHHSDLTHEGPNDEKDTHDVKEAHKRIKTIVGTWLAELKDENAKNKNE